MSEKRTKEGAGEKRGKEEKKDRAGQRERTREKEIKVSLKKWTPFSLPASGIRAGPPAEFTAVPAPSSL